MTDLGKLCQRVYDRIEWQRFPVGFTDSDKEKMILNAVIEGIRDLFVVTGRALEYGDYQFLYESPESENSEETVEETIEDGESPGEEDAQAADAVLPAEEKLPSLFTYDLPLDEEMYVLCAAQMVILGKVRAQYNDLLGYTTNALTVTNADKPYAYITGTMNELAADKRRYFYKMVRYAHLS